MKKATIVSSVLFALAGSILAQSPAGKPRPVPILGTELLTLPSKDTGRTYDLYIQKPANAAGKKLPVIYVLDGQWDFKLYTSVYGGLLYDKFVPEMLIVGITYTGDTADYGTLRGMDYTPVPHPERPGTGDAAKFLAFLKKDVFPMIEQKYNADPKQRIISGNSLGGLMTLYAMLTEPDLFMGYIASSPAVAYANDALFDVEKKFSEGHKDLKARLYITVGGKEGLRDPVKRMMQTLSTRGYKGLKMEAVVMETEGHTSNKPETYNRGLRFMFAE